MRRWTVAWVCSGWLVAALLAAQEGTGAGARASAPRQPAKPGEGMDAEAMALFRLCRMADTNGDLMVEEKELNEAFRRLQQDAASVHATLLKWLDTDKNGALSPEELRPFQVAVQMLQLLRGIDQNGDLALQDTELDAAFARMAEICQNANDRLLSQFDRDRDGKLADEELRMARQGLGMVPGPVPNAGVASAPGAHRGPPRGGRAGGARAAAP